MIYRDLLKPLCGIGATPVAGDASDAENCPQDIFAGGNTPGEPGLNIGTWSGGAGGVAKQKKAIFIYNTVCGLASMEAGGIVGDHTSSAVAANTPTAPVAVADVPGAGGSAYTGFREAGGVPQAPSML